MKSILFILPLALICTVKAQTTPSTAAQIQLAVLALPEAYRAEATVMGYDDKNELIELRKGTNGMLCIADDPNREGFDVSGYHQDLEPFMKRGRELKASGLKFQEVFDKREEEVKAGKLSIPQGSVLYVVTGDMDAQGQPTNLYQRFVVYIPYATAETTGLPLSPSYPGGPWIMNPGTHRAHIMINPTKVEE